MNLFKSTFHKGIKIEIVDITKIKERFDGKNCDTGKNIGKEHKLLLFDEEDDIIESTLVSDTEKKLVDVLFLFL